MNKIVLLITIFIISVVLILSYFYEQDDSRTSIDAELIPIKDELIELQQDKEFNQLTKEEQLEKTKEVLEKIPESHNRLKEFYKKAISPLPVITFYGRIIDQYGEPVSNASVWYSGINAYLSAGGGRGTVKTDSDGYFMIDTTGAALDLGTIKHPEIEPVLYQIPNYKRARNSQIDIANHTMLFESHSQREDRLNYKDYSTKENAYIIHASRKGKYEGAIKGRLGAYYNFDGRQYTLNLLGNNYKSKVMEGVHEGHLIVSCTRKAMKNHRDFGDWTAYISPINGGIQETNDLYMTMAPESGYQSSISIDMKFGSDDYQYRILNKRYYFMAGNGKVYGSLFVRFEPHARDKDELCRIEIESYTVNPTASRNLTLQSSK